MKKYIYRRVLILLLFINVIAIGLVYTKYCKDQLPNTIHVYKGDDTKLQYNVPAIAKINKQVIRLNEPFVLKTSDVGQYEMEATLFGKIPLKKIKISVVKNKKAIPSGKIAGIYVETDGLLVLDTETFTGIDKRNYAPSKNKLYEGDYILALNNQKVSTKTEFVKDINKSGSKPISLKVRRNNHITTVKVEAKQAAVDHQYKIGAWIRDNTQGIGTITYTIGNSFAGLGHGITDMDTGKLIDVKSGFLIQPVVDRIQKGKDGNPGEIIGSIYYKNENVYGIINGNENTGIYGNLQEDSDNKAYSIGFMQDVKKGKAYIISEISGKKERYEIEITKVRPVTGDPLKGMEIQITDKRLLKLTNGIVQGMSGSPIIQNDHLIGAVTHVFVNDSTKGYAIFIENMLENND